MSLEVIFWDALHAIYLNFYVAPGGYSIGDLVNCLLVHLGSGEARHKQL